MLQLAVGFFFQKTYNVEEVIQKCEDCGSDDQGKADFKGRYQKI